LGLVRRNSSFDVQRKWKSIDKKKRGGRDPLGKLLRRGRKEERTTSFGFRQCCGRIGSRGQLNKKGGGKNEKREGGGGKREKFPLKNRREKNSASPLRQWSQKSGNIKESSAQRRKAFRFETSNILSRERERPRFLDASEHLVARDREWPAKPFPQPLLWILTRAGLLARQKKALTSQAGCATGRDLK